MSEGKTPVQEASEPKPVAEMSHREEVQVPYKADVTDEVIKRTEILQTELEEVRRERDALKNQRNAIQVVRIVFTELLKIVFTTLLKVIFRL